MCAQKLGIWKILIFFIDIAGARTGAMGQLVSNRGLLDLEPQPAHYNPQYGDKGGAITKKSAMRC